MYYDLIWTLSNNITLIFVLAFWKNISYWVKTQKGKRKQQASSAGYIIRTAEACFRVILTFSLSPKRHVVCQRAFIKLNQRLKKNLHRDLLTGYQRRCLMLLWAGVEANSILWKQPFPSSVCLLRAADMHSGERWTNVGHDIKAAFHREQHRISCRWATAVGL